MDRSTGVVASAAASRAERFEDEKHRIVESCFSKKDVDGPLIETYITHIRITEYSSHPTTPPPPQARGPEAAKPRVIIVAVRKSGRVRMHKSKENVNGTFSIGKTWNLDDLSHIESYTGPQVSANYREWGGETGFLVTIGKPYFWQAQTDKEKKFFIASLIKIYSKYTGGKVPNLSGFDQRELDQVLGAGKRHNGAVSRPPLPDMSLGMTSNGTPSPIVPPTTGVDPTRSQRVSPVRMLPHNSDSPSRGSTSVMSTERSARLPSEYVNNYDPVTNSHANGGSEDDTGFSTRSYNTSTGSVVVGRIREMGGSSEHPLSANNAPVPPQQHKDTNPPPERKRPPMDPARPQDRNLVPLPLMSPVSKRDPIVPPPRSSERGPFRNEAVDKPTDVDVSMTSRDILLSPTSETLDSMKLETTPSELSEAVKVSAIDPIPYTNTQSVGPSRPPSSEPLIEPEGDIRPGLGPMIKSKKSKGEIAGVIWKAASAATAFRPRPGGAGDRLRQANIKNANGPDGITSVIPAPPRPDLVDEVLQTIEKAPEEPLHDICDQSVPEVKVTVSSSSRPVSLQEPFQISNMKEEASKKEPTRSSVMMRNDAKYLRSIGLDPVILDPRSEQFGKWLDFFGWVPGQQMRSRNIQDVKTDLERELNKAQAGGWIARFREEDERVDGIKRGIDLAIDECDELDNLLTLYSVELSTLSDDISYIETQSQGLQVQTANQKLLKNELKSLLETCAITSNDLEALRLAPLDTARGLDDVESALVTLYRAMTKIDPSLGLDESGLKMDTMVYLKQTLALNNDYGNMRIVREKKETYMQENTQFMRRLHEFMSKRFEDAYTQTKKALDGALSKKVDATHHDIGRGLLWKYSPLMLYARDVDLDNWGRLIQVYQDKTQPLYKVEFQGLVSVWRKNAKKMTGEEIELLFTSQIEKQQEGVASTARKMTVKRSQTIARALRSPLSDAAARGTLDQAGTDTRSLPYEVFSGVLDDLLPLVEMEQNFITDFFHATTLEQIDFPDAVLVSIPRERRGGDLKRHRLMEPDRELARRVTRSMEMIFNFLEAELQRLMEWVVGQDALQGVGVLAVLERKLTEIGQSNQEYLNALLQRLYGVLEGRFRKFVDDQIRAIEDTKVKINKRKGVISFIRVFPAFLTAAESMTAGLDSNVALRRMMDSEYDRIMKSMFDSLMVIARENPATGITIGSTDPEGKEALNFHILLIENMNHFLEETDSRGLEVLEEWNQRANTEYHEHMSLYLNAVMRRPLGKLLDHLENIETQLQTGKSPTSIAQQPSNSKAIFSKVLSNFDSKEVRKGVETLRKRVEKHFGDADDPTLSRGLVAKVLQECEAFYGDVENRVGRVTTVVYGGDVPFEWPRADVKVAFR